MSIFSEINNAYWGKYQVQFSDCLIKKVAHGKVRNLLTGFHHLFTRTGITSEKRSKKFREMVGCYKPRMSEGGSRVYRECFHMKNIDKD